MSSAIDSNLEISQEVPPVPFCLPFFTSLEILPIYECASFVRIAPCLEQCDLVSVEDLHMHFVGW